MSYEDKATEQQVAIGKRAVEAVLERVASAVQAGIPGCDPDLIMSGQYERMHRLEGTGVDPVYLRVTASWLPASEARRLFPGADGDPDTTSAGRTAIEPELGFQKEIARAKKGHSK